jgi:hypothetical protein
MRLEKYVILLMQTELLFNQENTRVENLKCYVSLREIMVLIQLFVQ